MQANSIQDLESSTLTNIFAEIGSQHGYTTVTAEFSPFRDLKVSWQRSYRNVEFHVADYLKDGSEEVLRSLAETIFAKIAGEEDRRYSDEFCRYITSEEFLKRHQFTYLKRSRNITMSQSGEFKNLNDSYQRLVDAGYVKKDDNLVLSWMRNEGTGSSGYCSPIMHVIVISRMLDRDDVPDSVIDYVVLNQLLRMEEGLANFCRKRNETADKIRTSMEGFPDKEGARRWIEDCCIQL